MSLAFKDDYMPDRVGPVVEAPLERLCYGERARSGDLDEAHIGALAETAGQWPPIVIWGEECVVVDGAHRVESARRLGRRTITAVHFRGTGDEAFVESVRRNVEHGLPLSVSDRRRAALRILSRHPEWSDRRTASLCGLSGKTVARLRRDELGEDEGVIVSMERRVGRDGKSRPIQSGEVRQRIRVALQENPTASLRTIASIAGASPETVRTVRARIADDVSGDQPVSRPARAQRAAPAEGCTASAVDLTLKYLAVEDVPPTAAWISDPALIASRDGGDFARWFSHNRVGEDWHQYVWSIPLGRVYEIVDEARRRAAAWTSFASLLESRTH